MTERERRALGLPLSPAQVALAESLQKDVIERMQYVTAQVSKAVEPIQRVAQELHENTNFYTRLSAPIAMPPIERPVFISVPSRAKDTAPIDYDVLADKVAEKINAPRDVELFYNHAIGELSRTVLGRTRTSTFVDTEGNKRKKIFERVFRGGTKFVKTEDLMLVAGCSDKQSLTKIVQGINAKVRKDLQIPKLVDGRRGPGYRIHPDVSIRKV